MEDLVAYATQIVPRRPVNDEQLAALRQKCCPQVPVPPLSPEEQLIAKLEALHLTPHSLLVVRINEIERYRDDEHFAYLRDWFVSRVELVNAGIYGIILDEGARLEEIQESQMNVLGWYRRDPTA